VAQRRALCIESETRCAREKSCREPSPERIVLTIEKFKISKSFRSIPTTGCGRPIPATRAILQVHSMFVLLSFDCVPAPSGSLVRSIVPIYLKMANLGGSRQPGCCAPRLDLSFEAGERLWAGVVVHRRESATPPRLRYKLCESVRYRVPGPMSCRLENVQVRTSAKSRNRHYRAPAHVLKIRVIASPLLL
jgi:hypothetical protein